MSFTLSLPAALLQPLEPYRDTLGTWWEHVCDGVANAPDPTLASAHLSRVLEHGHGSGSVLASPTLCRDLLFLLGSSEHLTNVLLKQGAEWEAVFLTDCHSPGKTVVAHLAVLRAQLPLDLPDDEFPRGLRVYRNREYLRIGTRDLLAIASLEETVRDLSTLAEAAVQIAYEYARECLRAEYGEAVIAENGGQRPLGFVVFGMGKFGGEELNFSSDIDLIYLYERDDGFTTGGSKGTTQPRMFFTQLAQRLTRTLSDLIAGGRVFRVDLRLRPDGDNGAMVNSLPNTMLYYESWGQTWERVALLKARPVAGDKALGEQFLHDISPFVFRRYLDFSTIQDIKEMKGRVERALPSGEHNGFNVKLGRGGIREVEFVAQAIQLLHVGKDPQVRMRSTLAGLDRLVERKYLAASDGAALQGAYRFLRHVEHKLQMVQDRQTHSLPTNEAALVSLARRVRVGRPETDDRGPEPALSDPQSAIRDPQSNVLARFHELLRVHTEAVHQIFHSLFHGADAAPEKPDEEASRLMGELHQEERTLWRLQKWGFRNLPESYEHLKLLHDGPAHSPASPKRRKLLYDLAPLLFAEISHAADPDQALASMATLVASIGARSSFLSLLRENPSTLRTLIGLFGASEYLTRIFLRHPELLDNLVRTDLVRVHKDGAAMRADLDARLAEVEEFEDQLDILRRYRTEEFLRVGINDSNRLLDVTEASAQLSMLAETCLVGAYDVARTALLKQLDLTALPGRLVIVGMGKLGARELNYNSDLDLIFLYEPQEDAGPGRLSAQECFTKLVQRLISVLQVKTREGEVYKIDTRLRPSGKSGSLVSSLAAFTRYHHESSQLWERQALIKARVVAGDLSLQAQVEELLTQVAYGVTIDEAGVAEIDHLRGRMEQELAHESGDRFNIKTGRGGIVDIEFLVQMLQLRYGQRHSTLRQRATLSALAALREAEILPEEEYQLLTHGYRFLRTLENRLRIERDEPVEALENTNEQLRSVARRLGYEGDAPAAQLLADYQRQRELIRACYARWFAQEKGMD